MPENAMEHVVGAFEDRMGLRRRMLAVAGVTMPESRLSMLQEIEERGMIVRCFECLSESTCVRWLETATARAEPPVFCPNAAAIHRLRALTVREGESHADL